ncbi:MAG: hypothetical protein ACAH88_21115 [Roseimicrobium sp.]
MKTVARMQQDHNLGQKETGVRDHMRDGNPLFALFDENNEVLQLWNLLDSDKMHDMSLGLVKNVAMGLAKLVIDGGPRCVQQFKARCIQLKAGQPRGFDATLWRDVDVRATSKTSLLHLLANGNLFAREFSALLFPMLLAFEAVGLDKVQEALDPVADLFHYVAALYSPFWPVNAEDSWWSNLEEYGITAYERVQSKLGNEVGKAKRIIKIHDLLVHGLRARRLHGAGVGTEGMEGLFAVFRRFSSNCRNVGVQIMERLACDMDAQRNALCNNKWAQAIRDIAGEHDSAVRQAGSVPRDDIGCAAQVDALLGADERGGEFVKWIHLETESVAGACRGVRKLFAVPHWHDGEQFDFVLQGNIVYHLRALYKKQDGSVIAFGIRLPYIFDRFHLPVHCVVPGTPVERIAESITTTIVLQAWPWCVPAEGARCTLLHQCMPSFDPRTHRLLAMNVFCVRGEMRYDNPLRWFPHTNRGHLDSARAGKRPKNK